MDWNYALIGPELIPLDNPCDDCAVVCNLYKEHSEMLSMESIELQEKVSKRWFCHNDRTRACRGNWNLLNGDKWTSK